MDYWPYFIGPALLLGSAVIGVWSRRNIMEEYRKQKQQNATASTGQPTAQNTAPQSQFAEQSSINRERLQNTKPQVTQQQTIIMMPKEPKVHKQPKMPKQPKAPKPSNAVYYKPKEKLPHFCKAPNDGDMIKRY
ncbi:uncharacterized protein [Chironomus tepperi]|uniref:uncharacterized protein n=1 Tax=Chironomus tepperi TaxID=113505 RepID=UPI00391F2107